MALSDNLVAYYKLDETSGTTVYDALGNYNGTNNGATVNQAGKINKAYDFEKSESDYITTPINSQLTNTPFSINIWFNAESFTEDMTLIGDRDSSGNNEWSLKLNSSKILSTLVYWSSAYQTLIDSPTALTEGTWYMATLTYTTNNVKLYVNGVEKATDNSAILRPSNPNRNMQIGRWNEDTSQRYFDGLIDEVGIWNRALSSTEVAQLYNSGDGLTYPFPINATIYPATLALSTTEQTTNIRLNFAGEALQSTLSLKTAIISAINPVYKFGQKELRTSWDALTALDPTKAVGHIQNLVPETSLVPSRYNVGI